MSYEELFLRSLVLTLLVEVPIVFVLSKYVYKLINKWNVVFVAVLASALTLPYFWFVLPAYISERTLYIIVGESVIILIEAFIFHRLLKLKIGQALLVSLIANLASILVGLL